MTEEERAERRRWREMTKRTKAFLPKVQIFPLRINMVMPHREDKSVGPVLKSLLKKWKWIQILWTLTKKQERGRT